LSYFPPFFGFLVREGTGAGGKFANIRDFPPFGNLPILPGILTGPVFGYGAVCPNFSPPVD